MKVLILDQYSDRGGGQRMLLETLCAIRQQRWNALVAMPGDGPMFGEVESLGFRAARISCGPYTSGRKSASDALRFAAELPRLAAEIAALAAHFAPQRLYVNGPRLLPAVLLSRVPAPVLFHAHISAASEVQRWTAGIALRELDARVVANSQSVADCWRPFAPVTVIRNAVRGPDCPLAPRLEAPPRIGCIGRISPEKGQREFLEIAVRILDRIPDARFFIYGAPLFDDPLAKQYDCAIRRAAADLPVVFPGWMDDVYDAFDNLDLLLVPSVWPEPNALVILEAFAAGVPVIAFRKGGIPEFLDQLADSPKEMAELAVAILSDRERYDALAEAGHRSWRENYHPDRYRKDIGKAIPANLWRSLY